MTPIVALHGFIGSGQDFESLDPRGVWSCPDLQGHGEHSSQRVPSRYRFLSERDRLLAQIAPERALLIGYSMGARLALSMAIRQPSRWSGLVLISGTAGLDGPERPERVLADQKLAQSIRRDGVAHFLSEWKKKPVIRSQSGINKTVRDAMTERRSHNEGEALALSLEGMGTGAMPSMWTDLPHLHCPALLVTGESDLKFTRLAGQMAALLPKAHHLALRGVGHCAHLEAPSRFLRALNAFCTERLHLTGVFNAI